MTKSYILGALHDATRHKNTFRISQKGKTYVKFIAASIKRLGGMAWVYREGKLRSVWVAEFSASFLSNTQIITQSDRIEYIRGYFDAEGGIAKSDKVRYYIYFCQKNRQELEEIKAWLEELNIYCGVIHNPSKKVDPNYFRFFVSAKSYKEFARVIGSYHPEKSKLLRMKI